MDMDGLVGRECSVLERRNSGRMIGRQAHKMPMPTSTTVQMAAFVLNPAAT